jgi:uncharacterized membrane protein
MVKHFVVAKVETVIANGLLVNKTIRFHNPFLIYYRVLAIRIFSFKNKVLLVLALRQIVDLKFGYWTFYQGNFFADAVLAIEGV